MNKYSKQNSNYENTGEEKARFAHRLATLAIAYFFLAIYFEI
jgi:hypothetical protein